VADWREPLDEFVDLLKDVEGIGAIFNYPPDLREPEIFKKLATSFDAETNKPIINCWFIERTGAQDFRGGERAEVCLGQAIRLDTYRITGLYGYAKGGLTNFEFQALVERVLDTLLNNVSLGGHGGWVAKAPTLRSADLREFGDYLSHCAEIEVIVQRPIEVTFT